MTTENETTKTPNKTTKRMTFRHRIAHIIYHVRHNYFTMNNLVIAVALFIALGWTWGSIGRMQQNYALQKQQSYKEQQLELAKLEVDNLKYQQNYFKTDEYKELAVRTALGYGMPGEKVLILPEKDNPTSDTTAQPSALTAANSLKQPRASNFSQWINFFFGGAGK